MSDNAFNPRDWYWIVSGDTSRAWSSRLSDWVAEWPTEITTPIASGAELSAVLRVYGLRGPVALIEDVRAEASRRMQLLVGARDASHLDIIISNGTREAVRLLRAREDRPWTEAEVAREAQLRALDAAIESIRDASNIIETLDPIPADYADNSRWP